MRVDEGEIQACEMSGRCAHDRVRTFSPRSLLLCTSAGRSGASQRFLHCEIKYEKTQSQHNVFQECGVLYLISGCRYLVAY